jgi:5-methylcytosine-specific restriction protein A
MPRRPPSPCTHPGCPALVDGGGRCPDHRDQRASAARRGYGFAHQRWRAAILARDPFCVVPGCGKPSTDADHITPIRQGGNPFDLANGQGLCREHHSQKTARDDGGFGRAPLEASRGVPRGVATPQALPKTVERSSATGREIRERPL